MKTDKGLLQNQADDVENLQEYILTLENELEKA